MSGLGLIYSKEEDLLEIKLQMLKICLNVDEEVEV
jgi:hypothetical protein